MKSKQGEFLHRPPIEATGNDDGLAITVFNSTVGEMSSPVKSKHGEFFAPPVEVTGNDGM
jgi:ATP-dependent exoDNAse (exonuclease V) alpha subunit